MTWIFYLILEWQSFLNLGIREFPFQKLPT